MIRRPLLSLAIAVAPLVAGCGGESTGGRPNVLLITLDTTRADFLSTYGRIRDLTPSLDRLAAEGTRFDLAISTAAVTPVAHASILSGRNNHEHNLRVLTARGGYRLPTDVPTLATVLQANGYTTAAIHSAFPVSSYFGFERGFDHFDDLDTEFASSEEGDHVDWDIAGFQRRSDETSDRVLAFLAQTDAPFLLWAHYWDPHDPKKRPPGHTARGMKQIYAEEIAYMDSQIGRVFDELRASGRADDTIVVVVADHGQGLNDHDWPGHRILYQEEIRVPLLMSFPGHDQKESVPDLVRTTDILPTLLDYLGLENPPGVSGSSLRGLIEGKSEAGRVAFADQINRFDENAKMIEKRPNDDFLYCAMDRDWKLVYRPSHPELSELYAIASDPGETENVYATQPDQALRLLKLLAEQAPWVTEPPTPIEDADREGALGALSALGYAEGSGDAAPLDFEWEWTCPDPAHEATSSAPAPCAQCSTPLIPRAR